MRIIAGQWRGRKLAAPPGEATRPTADRTRETLFSMLASRLGSFEGLAVADLFAGSGALGLEALSRGAAHCMFVEQDPAAIRRSGTTSPICARRRSATCAPLRCWRSARPRQPLDLILLDPPYGSGAGSVALDKLLRLGWIGEATWISLETAADEEPDVKGWKPRPNARSARRGSPCCGCRLPRQHDAKQRQHARRREQQADLRADARRWPAAARPSATARRRRSRRC